MQDNRGNARVTSGPPRGWEKFKATRRHRIREEHRSRIESSRWVNIHVPSVISLSTPCVT